MCSRSCFSSSVSKQYGHAQSSHIHYYIIRAFIMRTHSVVILNQRRHQSLGWQHGMGVDGLFEKVSLQMVLRCQVGDV